MADLGQHAGAPLAAAVVLHQPRLIALLRRGRSVRRTVAALRGGGLIQIGGRFSEDIEHSHNTFDRPGTGARVYTVNLLNTRTTYQFTKELAIRAIVRYDSQQDKVLTDFLGSYDLRPGTVVYVGARLAVSEARIATGSGSTARADFLTTQQGLFLKASYLYRF